MLYIVPTACSLILNNLYSLHLRSQILLVQHYYCLRNLISLEFVRIMIMECKILFRKMLIFFNESLLSLNLRNREKQIIYNYCSLFMNTISCTRALTNANIYAYDMTLNVFYKIKRGIKDILHLFCKTKKL